MAELGITLAERLIEVTGSAVIKKVCEMWNYQSELEHLNTTVKNIKNILFEVDSKRDLSASEQAYIDELKAILYDADDLFDEFHTRAELNQLNSEKNHNFLKTVRHLFCSKKNEVSQANKMSKRVKKIKEQLDFVANNHKKFDRRLDMKPNRQRRETYSHLLNENVVGRDDDKKKVIDMLLNSDIEEDVRFLTIVGVGGLGKTTLAKLVYHDEKIDKEFSIPALKLWVCVSDHDGEQFDVKSILCKILELLLGKNEFNGTSSLELVQNKFKENLKGKKYLLVLDDVWNENRNEWFELESLLKLGQRGSRILTTTRSKETAKIIGNNLAYNLNGLSPEDSWNLFMASAFDYQAEKHIDFLKFVELGKKIVEKCHNVPLAIVVVGRLLYRQEINKWRSLEESGMNGIGNGNNQIMSILKLSYHNLDFSLKRCFSYCALFSKDTRIRKDRLISLWIAQGYIVPFDKGQNLEDAAEEHFWTLLQRCFFQDVKKDKYGDVVSIKMHDLMHDVAQDVGLQEICVLSSKSSILGDKIRHANVDVRQIPEHFGFKSNIRSLLCPYFGIRIMESQRIGSMMCLRVLDLEDSSLKELPDWIGKLLHLRYLNLSSNHRLETLPGSITELHNLQTLMLCRCYKLRELPKDFGKLVKLRHLDLSGCDMLTSMPPSMKNLCNLAVLPYIVLGKDSEKECHGELDILESLTDIKGNIHIKIGKNYKNVNNRGVGCLKSSKYLMTLNVEFVQTLMTLNDTYVGQVDQEGVMEKLEPNSNLKEFILEGYQGKIIPRWGTTQTDWAVSFPYLVNIKLDCPSLEELPLLSKLRYLKSLVLAGLNLEYMEGTCDICQSNEDGTTTFFPSLEYLEVRCMRRLKGWWKVEGDGIRFPRLSHLEILNCPSLTAFPLPRKVSCIPGEEKEDSVGISENNMVGGLKTLKIDMVEYLNSMFVNRQSSIPEDGDIPLKSLIMSLRSLHFFILKEVELPITTNHAQYLTSLHTLKFDNCYYLETLPEWIGNLSSLRHLSISECFALESLPQSMTNLTSLHHLSIDCCLAIKSVPESMTKLTSLQSLEIISCPQLRKRCQKPNGEDWIKIQHVPNITIC